ncbi:MAG: hypothetical protein R3C53_08745 [Pirellulaceae bacterium]
MSRICLMFAILLAVPTANAWAGAITLTLSSTDDLENLTVGDVVTIDVNLLGLDESIGDFIDLLSADVLLPTDIFGTPNLPTAGGIISPADAADPFVFNPLSIPDFASASYFFGLNPIVANGVFFSFQATVQQAGTGQIDFDTPPQVLGLKGDFSDFIDTAFTGSPLNVVATSPFVAVPEPTTFAVWTMLACAGLAAGRRRR